MRFLSLLIFLSLSSNADIQAGPIYNVLPTPYGSVAGNVAGFSDNGWVAGFTGALGQAFVSDGTNVYLLPVLPNPSSGGLNAPLGVSATGQTVMATPPSSWLGTSSGWTALLGGSSSTTALGISDARVVVGQTCDSNGCAGTVWTGGVPQQIPGTSRISQISPSGNALLGEGAVGGTAFLRFNGTDTTLALNGDGRLSSINDAGEFAFTRSPGIPFVGPDVYIGTSAGLALIYPSALNVGIFPGFRAINNARQVVFTIVPSGGAMQGILWDPVNGARDLTGLAGVSIDFVHAINNRGQIIATSNGQIVLLDPISPVPEPGTWALMAAGLLLTIRRRQS